MIETNISTTSELMQDNSNELIEDGIDSYRTRFQNLFSPLVAKNENPRKQTIGECQDV